MQLCVSDRVCAYVLSCTQADMRAALKASQQQQLDLVKGLVEQQQQLDLVKGLVEQQLQLHQEKQQQQQDELRQLKEQSRQLQEESTQLQERISQQEEQQQVQEEQRRQDREQQQLPAAFQGQEELQRQLLAAASAASGVPNHAVDGPAAIEMPPEQVVLQAPKLLDYVRRSFAPDGVVLGTAKGGVRVKVCMRADVGLYGTAVQMG